MHDIVPTAIRYDSAIGIKRKVAANMSFIAQAIQRGDPGWPSIVAGVGVKDTIVPICDGSGGALPFFAADSDGNYIDVSALRIIGIVCAEDAVRSDLICVCDAVQRGYLRGCSEREQGGQGEEENGGFHSCIGECKIGINGWAAARS